MMATESVFDVESVLQFLAEFSWVHSYPVINYFTDELEEKLPVKWKDFLVSLNTEELNAVPFQPLLKQEKWPPSFSNFVEMCRAFSLDREQSSHETAVVIGQDLCRGMSPKKQHEVKKMAALVDELYALSQSEVVVDVGSGLGYLGHVLHKCFGRPVIGIEGNDGHVQQAERRSGKQGLSADCLKTIKFSVQPGEDNCKQLTGHLQRAIASIQPCDHCPPSKQEPVSMTSKSYENKYTSDFQGTCEVLKKCISDKAIQSCHHCPESKSEPVSMTSKSYENKYTSNFQGMCEDLKKFKTDNSIQPCLHCPLSKQEPVHTTSESNKNRYTSDCRRMYQDLKKDDAVLDESNIQCDKDDDLKGHEDICCVEGTEMITNESCQEQLIRDGENLVSTEDHSPFSHGHSLQSNLRQKKLISSKLKKAISGSVNSSYSCRHSEISKSSPFCLIGLHCCGDLSPMVLEYFTKITAARALCIVSCCYHKMNSTADSIPNFPLSDAWRSSYRKIRSLHPGWKLNSCSLRLAAQETRSRWKFQTAEQHKAHSMNVGFRALLEFFLKEADDEEHLRDILNRKTIRKQISPAFRISSRLYCMVMMISR